MVLDYFGKLETWNEETLAALRIDHGERHIGTCLDQMIEMFDKIGGFELTTTYDYAENPETFDLNFIREQIRQGLPVIIGWNDWGGHWQVIIGYDSMGTEDYTSDDVLIVADSFDTTDNNQDGYGIYGAERFFDNFTFYTLFPEDHANNMCFIIAKPVK